MKHPLRDILGHFSKHAGHTHEAAVQATYDLGHAAGKAEAVHEQNQAAPAPTPAPVQAGDDHAGKTESGAEVHEEGEHAEEEAGARGDTEQAPAAGG